MSNPRVSNQLINEKSPYLLQHAYNPVNWFPWGETAFQKAKEENKPIFLSIGYSTCHWCHVMEHESFEDLEVATILNDGFVAIKVDKEERPDIDSIYMTVCQAMTGHGGWPLTILMTWDQKPFFAGTYFPKHNKYQLAGLIELLNTIRFEWEVNKEKLLQSSQEITAILQQQATTNQQGIPSKNMIHKASTLFSQNFDATYGGFGSAPKFPTPHNLMFLLRYAQAERDPQALAQVEKTLQQMYKGGIFDHIGFGFSRYSTDKQWLAPHFEKMLYDNALLIITYLEAYQVTGNAFYSMVAQKTITYIIREMTSPEGGFYSAQDADSEGIEGKYYVFSPDEVIALLGDEDGAYVNQYFDITQNGNFEGYTIPNLINNKEWEETDSLIHVLCKKLYAYRLKRTTLHKDDKILTSWNALMIVALAKAYKILDNKTYLDVALNAVQFIQNKLTHRDHKLYVRYRDGDISGVGHIDDYAFYSWAMLELYEATFQPHYLEEALQYSKTMLQQFFDPKNGGFYLYANDTETLISRPKELYDGAIPSGNGVAAYVLGKLAKLTGDTTLDAQFTLQLSYIAGNVENYPAGYSFSMMAFLLVLYPSKEVVCVVSNATEIESLKKALGKKFLSNTTILVKELDSKDNLALIAPFTKDYVQKNQQTTFYICKNHTCSQPFHDVHGLVDLL